MQKGMTTRREVLGEQEALLRSMAHNPALKKGQEPLSVFYQSYNAGLLLACKSRRISERRIILLRLFRYFQNY